MVGHISGIGLRRLIDMRYSSSRLNALPKEVQPPMFESPETIMLYRPTGRRELELVRASGYREWPPRQPEQPIFYPVLNEENATQIARDWNARGTSIGYVTRFRVLANYLQRYEVHTVGGRVHQEYWIPAEELAEFNRNIVGLIEVIAEYHPPAS